MGGIVFSWSFALSLLAAGLSLLAVTLTAARTPTAHAKALQKLAAEIVSKWDQECALFEATRQRWSEEFSGIADRCEENLDRAEAKRRRAAASNSKPPAGQAAASADPWAGMTRDEIVTAGRRARIGMT